MSLEGFAAIFVGLGVAIAIYALLQMQTNSSGTNSAAEDSAHLARLLELIDRGSAQINLITAEAPLILHEKERAILVLPNTTLWEPKAVRISNGGYGGTSFRIATGFWIHSGRSRSSSQSFDKLEAADQGTLVVTNGRIAFLGTVKTVSAELASILSVDTYADGIGIHLKNKQKVECFHVASAMRLSWTEGGQQISVPFGGRVLEHVLKKAMHPDVVALEGAH